MDLQKVKTLGPSSLTSSLILVIKALKSLAPKLIGGMQQNKKILYTQPNVYDMTNCNRKVRYNPNASSTREVLNRKKVIQYTRSCTVSYGAHCCLSVSDIGMVVLAIKEILTQLHCRFLK